MKLPLKQIAVIFFALIITIPAFAQFNQAVWDTLTSDNSRDMLTQQAIAVNGYGQFHLAYSKWINGSGIHIYYRFYDMLAGLSPEILIDTNGNSHNPVIASVMGDDVSGVVIVFERDGDIWGCANTIPPGPWDFENVSNSAETDISPTIAYGYDAPQGAWITDDGLEYKIRYVRGEGDSIYFETIEDSQLGENGGGAQPLIVVFQNLPHIFYRGLNGNAYNIHHAYKIHRDSSWIIDYLETPNIDDYSAAASVDIVGNIHLAISGNDGWGMPCHVYYLKRDHTTGLWSTPDLVTGAFSATNGSIIVRPGNNTYIASCGVSGNIYDGNVYISNNTTGSFQTQLLAAYNSVTQPVLSDITGEYAVLVFDAPINGENNENYEIVYYGPQLNDAIGENPLPIFANLPKSYPNPFNSQVKITFNIAKPGQVVLDIFDITGRKVQALVDGAFSAGKYETTWRANGFATGTYFYRLTVAGNIHCGKMLLLK
jgi:hypothetical protein